MQIAPQLKFKFQTTGFLLGVLMIYGARMAAVALGQPVAGSEGALPPLQAPAGVMVGEVTSSSALIQLRLTRGDKLIDRDIEGSAGVVEFRLMPIDRSAVERIETVTALPERDYIARAFFSDLKPGTRYRCTTRIGSDSDRLQDAAGPGSQFKTLPGAGRTDSVSFAVVTGMNYAKFHGDRRIDKKQHLIENNTVLPAPYGGPDKSLGYPALETIKNQRPDFFIGTGDNVYYDTPDHPRAKTIPELRQKWHEQFIQPRFADLFATVPSYWMVDDHDYRIDDGDNSGDDLPLPETGRQMLLEQLPFAPANAPAAKTYRTHRVNQDLQIWFVENRMYRSPNAMPDGPDKTIWGVDQRQWLQRTLAASDARYKLLISPTPMVGPDDLRKKDNHCDVGGFQHERDDFFKFLKTSGLDQQNFFIVCGDRHWQYHAVDGSGFEEFSCGALVDANSRLARLPGDPEGTDPEGVIKHLHQQKIRSGGFLMVHCARDGKSEKPQLTFRFHDENGEVLYTCHK